MKYPKINYIGNKTKVAKWIIDHLPLKEGSVLDLFCGGCSVSYELKKNGYIVYTNDILFSNYVIAKSLIENKDTTLQLDFDEISIMKYYTDERFQQIQWLSTLLYYKNEVKELSSLLNFSDSLQNNEKYLFLSLLRRAMIRKLPYSRMNIKWSEIVKLRDEEYSYQKYQRRRAYHNQSFTYHILHHLNEYNKAIFNNKQDNKAHHNDALKFIEQMDFCVDMIYIDPPYPSTMNKYAEFYGYFDKMLGLDINIETDFTHKDSFLEHMTKIINLAKDKTKYIIISLNNKCNPSVDMLKETIIPIVSDIQIVEKEHIYQITGKENKNTHYEILMILTM